jgi:hypothetical protein
MTRMWEYSRPSPTSPLSSTHRGPVPAGLQTSTSCASPTTREERSVLDFLLPGGAPSLVVIFPPSLLPLAAAPRFPPTAPPGEVSPPTGLISSSASAGLCRSPASSRSASMPSGSWPISTSRAASSACGPGDMVADRESALIIGFERAPWTAGSVGGESGRQRDGEGGSGEVALSEAVCDGCSSSSSGSGHGEKGW